MAWASKKQYAILMGSDEGKELATKIGGMEQDEFQNAFAKLLGKSGNTSYKKEEDEDLMDDDEYDAYTKKEEQAPKETSNDDATKESEQETSTETKKDNPREKALKEKIDGMIGSGYGINRVLETIDNEGYKLDKEALNKYAQDKQKQYEIETKKANDRTTKNGFGYNRIEHPFIDENANILEEYNDGDYTYFIEQRKPDEFVNHYTGGTASGFKSLDEARQMMAKHRPMAKRGKSIVNEDDMKKEEEVKNNALKEQKIQKLANRMKQSFTQEEINDMMNVDYDTFKSIFKKYLVDDNKDENASKYANQLIEKGKEERQNDKTKASKMFGVEL